jgi:hypothetical protein
MNTRNYGISVTEERVHYFALQLEPTSAGFFTVMFVISVPLAVKKASFVQVIERKWTIVVLDEQGYYYVQ